MKRLYLSCIVFLLIGCKDKPPADKNSYDSLREKVNQYASMQDSLRILVQKVESGTFERSSLEDIKSLCKRSEMFLDTNRIFIKDVVSKQKKELDAYDTYASDLLKAFEKKPTIPK